MQIALFHTTSIQEQLIKEIEQSHAISSRSAKTNKTIVLELNEVLNLEQRNHLRNPVSYTHLTLPTNREV